MKRELAKDAIVVEQQSAALFLIFPSFFFRWLQWPILFPLSFFLLSEFLRDFDQEKGALHCCMCLLQRFMASQLLLLDDLKIKAKR